MQIEENISLKKLNTFQITSTARYFTYIKSLSDLHELRLTNIFKANKRFILGGGSNILLTGDYDGLIIKSDIKGIRTIQENDQEIIIQVGSGEVWHQLVKDCLSQNWGGIENLSLIPGSVGAAPIQNIGAYGMEVKEVITKVEGIDLLTGKFHQFNNAECSFGYRESIFKHHFKEFFFISSVTLRLSKKNHRIITEYGALKEYFEEQNIKSPTIHDVSKAVMNIRIKKLPDPTSYGNAGSFFKNPFIDEETLNKLKREYPSIPYYHAGYQLFKVSAGWLIAQSGWKGKRIGNVGVYENQALVIINLGHASGKEIFNFSMMISEDVEKKFGIKLHPEVNLI